MYNKGGRLEKRAAKLKTKSDKLKSEIKTVKGRVNVGLPDSMGMQGVVEKNFPNPTDKQRRKGNRLNKRSARVAGRMKDGGAKPDYLDMDGDGNKKESMKSAIQSKKGMGGKRKMMYKKGGEKKMMGGKKKMMGGGMVNRSFLEPATPTMFEDGGLKDLRKKQREERRGLKSKNKATKKSNKDVAKAARKGKRTAIKDIKKTSRTNIANVKDKASKVKASKVATAKSDPFVVRNDKPSNKPIVTKKVVPPTSNKKANELAGSNKTVTNKTVNKTVNKPVSEMTFGQAYRKNRDAGKKVFTYKGKKYTTESKSEKEKRTNVVKKITPRSGTIDSKKTTTGINKRTPRQVSEEKLRAARVKAAQEKKARMSRNNSM